jgi:hypothetical protein
MSAIAQTIADIPGAVMPQGRVLRSDDAALGSDIFRLLASGAVLAGREPIQRTQKDRWFGLQ